MLTTVTSHVLDLRTLYGEDKEVAVEFSTQVWEIEGMFIGEQFLVAL